MIKDNEISKEEFIKCLKEWNKCYMQKPKSRQKIWLWWENEGYTNNQWFMNIARSNKTGIEQSSLIIATYIDHWIDFKEREGYKYYSNE
jgi:hypothetical protein